MKTILFSPRNAISKVDKKKLSDEGYIVIEVDDASQIKTVTDLSLIGSDTVAIAAIETINQSTTPFSVVQAFGQKIIHKTIAILNSQKPEPKQK